MDEITPEWLTAALRSSGHLQSGSVSGVEKVTIGQGVGILGELSRMTPVYSAFEPRAPKTLIAKIPTADEGGPRNRSDARVLRKGSALLFRALQ
jgi:hypothetical protein